MRKTLTLLTLLLATAVLSLGCAKKAPPPEPTAQEFFDRGITAFNQENFTLAGSDFEMAVAKSPGFVEAHYYLGLACWKLNMNEKAKQAFVNTLNLNPSHLSARESLGLLCYKTGDFPRAKRHLEAARNLNSINPEVYLALGNIYVMESRCPEALEVFQRGMMMDSGYLPLKTASENARRLCGKGGKGGGKAAPKVIYEKKFRGGGKALDPNAF